MTYNKALDNYNQMNVNIDRPEKLILMLYEGALRFANFATGDMMSFGTMVAILFTWYFQSLGISLGVLPTALLAIPFAVVFMICIC